MQEILLGVEKQVKIQYGCVQLMRILYRGMYMYSVMFNHLEGNNDVRPVFIASINGRSMTCLLDSGAKLPMFYGNKMLFDSYFSGNANLLLFFHIIFPNLTCLCGYLL